jgi:carbon monoxide dehydrogenase subunit G
LLHSLRRPPAQVTTTPESTLIARRRLPARSWDKDGALLYCSLAGRILGVVLMPERHITVQRRMAAPTAAVWAVFADFPNLASHWSGLQATSAIGDQTSGVGARRHVELKPIGSMDETVTTWEDGRRIDTENHPSAAVPFTRAETILTLEPDHEGTLATFDYRYAPRGGPIGRFTGPLIDKMLTATFTEMLAATEEAALAKSGEQ